MTATDARQARFVRTTSGLFAEVLVTPTRNPARPDTARRLFAKVRVLALRPDYPGRATVGASVYIPLANLRPAEGAA